MELPKVATMKDNLFEGLNGYSHLKQLYFSFHTSLLGYVNHVGMYLSESYFHSKTTLPSQLILNKLLCFK